MTSLPLVFIAGVLGSAHCIGMCGPIALTIGGGTTTWRDNLSRQSLFTLGRVFTYGTFGATAGAAGLYLQRTVPSLLNIAAALAMIAGALLVYQGLLAAGVIRRRHVSTANTPCLASEFLATFMKSPGLYNVFLAGLFTGMLPCGLVYGFVALAAATGSLVQGAMLMIAFGLGTAPVMMLTGAGGTLLSLAARRHIYRIAAWCVVVTGLLSIARGASFVELPNRPTAGCPLCE